jgi:hypothetical protein
MRGLPAASTRRSAALALLAMVVLLPLPVATARATAALAMDAPTVEVAPGGKLSQALVPLRVSWPAAPSAGGTVSQYILERDSGSGWVAVTLPSATARAVTVKVSPWLAHAFRVRATYQGGATTEWGVRDGLWLGGVDEADLAVAYAGTWTQRADTSAYGGARASSSTAGASATLTFSAAGVAWVGRRAPKMGRARVYIDEQLVTTVDLRASRKQPRRVVFSATFDSVAERTLRIEVLGTAGRPRVDVDHFLTLAPPTSALLVGAGDIGRCGSAAVGQTADLITGLDTPYTVYTTGDNAYPNGTAEEFANCYDPYWGAFKSVTRPSPGNHDNVYGLDAYFDYFGANAGPRGRGWYAYGAGTWRVYSLNSEACRSSNSWCGPGSAQYDWLRADLVRSPHACVLAYWHRPRWSSGEHGGSTRMSAINALLYEHGADVVLAGHDHTYERFQRLDPSGQVDDVAGIRHFVIGTGGAALYAFAKPPLATTVVRQADIHGVLRLDLHPGTYDWEFLPVADGVFEDAGSGVCH